MNRYTLEFIDNGFLSFKSLKLNYHWDGAGNKVIGASIHYTYIISQEFKRLNSNNIQKYLTNLSKFSQTCNRWSLDFDIIRDELTVIEVAPKYIQEFVRNNQSISFSYGDSSISWRGYREVSLCARFNRNLEFFIEFKPLVTGKKEDVEKFISNRIKIGKGYRLEFISNLPSGQYQYQIVDA